TRWLIIARRVRQRLSGLQVARCPPTIPAPRTAVEAAADSGSLAAEGTSACGRSQPSSDRRAGEGSSANGFGVPAADPDRADERRRRDRDVDPDGNEGHEFRGGIGGDVNRERGGPDARNDAVGPEEDRQSPELLRHALPRVLQR